MKKIITNRAVIFFSKCMQWVIVVHACITYCKLQNANTREKKRTITSIYTFFLFEFLSFLRKESYTFSRIRIYFTGLFWLTKGYRCTIFKIIELNQKY